MHDLPPYKFIEALKKLYCIKTLYLFGSRARGDNFPKSDIDLAVEFIDDDDFNRNVVNGIIENADTLLKIDWVDIKKVSKEFFDVIMKEAIKL